MLPLPLKNQNAGGVFKRRGYFFKGVVAQLGERSTGSAEVRGSIPLNSNKKSEGCKSSLFLSGTGDRNEDTTCVECESV